MFTTATSIEPAIVGMSVLWMCSSAINRSRCRISGGIDQYSRLTEDLVRSSLSFSARSSSTSLWAVFVLCCSSESAWTSQTIAKQAMHKSTPHTAFLLPSELLPSTQFQSARRFHQMVLIHAQLMIRSSAVTRGTPCNCAVAAIIRSSGSDGKSAGSWPAWSATLKVTGQISTPSVISLTVAVKLVAVWSFPRPSNTATSNMVMTEIANDLEARARRIALSAARDKRRGSRWAQIKT